MINILFSSSLPIRMGNGYQALTVYANHRLPRQVSAPCGTLQRWEELYFLKTEELDCEERRIGMILFQPK